MREHSGRAEGKNNNRNPTLRDAERAKGRSGAAMQKRKKQQQAMPERKSTAKSQMGSGR